MCGVFGYIGQRDDAPLVCFEGIKLLEYRGYDSWGVACVVKNGNLKLEKHTGKIGSSKLSKSLKSSVALSHTRWATHGGVSTKNAHPHLDCNKRLAVVHNGIVENYQQIKQDLLPFKHVFKSETDTEVISHLVEQNLKRKSIKDAVFSAFKSLNGSNAICVLDKKTQTIVACRNGSPLVVGIDTKNKQYFLASDVPAFLKYTNEVYFLNDGEGVEITKNGVKVFNLSSGKEIKLKTQKLDWEMQDAQKGGYPHFLIKEINEQPKTIAKGLLPNEKAILKVVNKIKRADKVILLGCGSAYYCCLAAKYFFANHNTPSEVYGAYEYTPFSKFVTKKTVVIAVSQSGETADTLIATKQAKQKGSIIVSVVNARGSTLERISDITIPVYAGPEVAVVSTKAFTAQLATLYLIASSINKKYQTTAKDIQKLSKSLSTWLNKKLNSKIINIVKTIKSSKHIFVIGKNINYPAALEFGLKIKETSYIHAEAFTAGELKHGVITLIQKDTPCFVLCSQDSVKEEVLSSAAEIKARGGKIIGVAPFESKEFDELIKTPNTNNLTIFGNIIVGQLLGYYLGVTLRSDPDKPRNLAKSVTVK